MTMKFFRNFHQD